MSDSNSASIERLWPTTIATIDISLETIAANLAMDEILLTDVNQNCSGSILRFWECQNYAVVLGRSNRAETEVDLDACRRDCIPVVRRSSGGGTVVLGPGCLAYSLFLPLTDEHRSLGIAPVTHAVMNRMAQAVRPAIPGATSCGTSDLAVGDRKFSGNSQRWLSRALLHHGTLLYRMDLNRVGRYLRQPSRQPDYRNDRDHSSFVTCIPVLRETLVELITITWAGIPQTSDASLVGRTQQLAKEKYSRSEWSILPTITDT